MTFGAMGACLKLHDFSGLPGGTPEFRQRTSGVVDCCFLGAVENHLPCFMAQINKTSDIRYETTGHQDCKTVIQGNPSQPGGPNKGGRRIYIHV